MPSTDPATDPVPSPLARLTFETGGGDQLTIANLVADPIEGLSIPPSRSRTIRTPR